MNIIFHRYNSICEPDYIEAFNSLGIEVIEDRTDAVSGGGDINSLVRRLGELVLKNHPMFVFSINFFPYISIVCEKLGVKYVCVSVDCPVMEIYNTAIRNRCNRVFLFDHQQYLSIKEENPDNIYHLPLGAAPERIDRTIGGFDRNHVDYKYDISFVGSLYNEKDPYTGLNIGGYEKGYLDALLTAQGMLNGLELIEEVITPSQIQAIKEADPSFYPSDMGIYNLDRIVAINNYLSYHLTYRDRIRLLADLSNNLKDVKVHLFTLSNTDELRKYADPEILCCHGGVSSLVEMPGVFRSSKININHTMRSIRTGLPQRIWDVMGSGGFLLTNDQEEIPEYLEPGRHLETYRNTEELIRKVDYYLEHDEERRQIAYEGYEAVKANHTVLCRVMEMIRMIG